MEVLCLVRHGETDWNRDHRFQGVTDVPLNAVGVEQARRCGLWLARERWDTVLSSPLVRAKTSAEIIAAHVGGDDVCLLEDLRERDYGNASGLTKEQVVSRYPDGLIPEMEERASVEQRATRALEWTISRYIGKRVILVSHGALINSVLAKISEGRIGSGKTVLKNACLNRISHENGRWSLDCYNVTEHLNCEFL